MPDLEAARRIDITEDKVKMIAEELFNFTGSVGRNDLLKAYVIGNLKISFYGGLYYAQSSLLDYKADKLPTPEQA